jgi:two-component system repressor protein LuxO
MDLELQKKLLRFIQTGTFRKVGSNKLETVDVRFVCATNRDPLQEVKAGRFREDLFYRLHVVPLRLPPLRERDRDVLLIADRLLAQFSAQSGKAFTGFSSDAQDVLLRYPWPGNVRQLQNAVQNAVVLHDGQRVEASMLPAEVREGHITEDSTRTAPPITEAVTPAIAPAASLAGFRSESALDARRAIEPLWMVEKRAIEAAIAACDGNINRAAGLLEVAPSTLYRKKQSWENAG